MEEFIIHTIVPVFLVVLFTGATIILGIEGASAYVRISEIKKQAIKKLVDNVDSSQVLDFL